MIALVVLGITLPLTAAGLYALGQRAILGPAVQSTGAGRRRAAAPGDGNGRRAWNSASSEQPDDAEGWHRLGRAYAVLGRAEAASAAYARAYKLRPDNPELVAEYAAFLYNGDPQNTGGQVFGLFSHLLKLDPENRDALWFLGFAAYQKADYKKALGYWEHLLKTLPADSHEAEHLRAIIAKTRENLGKNSSAAWPGYPALQPLPGQGIRKLHAGSRYQQPAAFPTADRAAADRRCFFP